MTDLTNDRDASLAARSVQESVVRAKAEIQKAIVGQDRLIEEVLVCLLCRGHALLEGVPGLGKTYLIRTIGDVLDLSTRRIQFTPDLMPADIIGTNILVQDESGSQLITFQKGPIFSNVVLADEINRATPKTQSALLEAMQEQRVTVGGVEYRLEPPFIVLATQNPIEMEGTYPLPEAQMDRFFFKLVVEYPDASDVMEILERTTGAVDPTVSTILRQDEVLTLQSVVREVPATHAVKEYAVRLVYATHPDSGSAPGDTKTYVRYGASPRGAQSLVLASKVFALLDGRLSASFEDVRRAALPSLRHRIILNFQGEAEGMTTDDIVRTILEQTPETR